MADTSELEAFIAVARCHGFRDAARATGRSASTLSEAVRRLEERLSVRLLHRSTRSVTPTEAGARLLERLGPAVDEVKAALDSVAVRSDQLVGSLRINVPTSAARLVLPQIVPAFVKAHPGVKLEIVAEESFVDVIEAGCDAGIRYDERLEQDVIAIPIGPRVQRFATAAAPSYLETRGRPAHPSELLGHACLLGRFASGATTSPWEFERDGEIVRVEPRGNLTVSVGGAVDLLVDAAAAGVGVIHLFEEWLAPHIASGTLEPILPDWWQPFPGPFLYYSGGRLVPPPLRAFIDFVRSVSADAAGERPRR